MSGGSCEPLALPDAVAPPDELLRRFWHPVAWSHDVTTQPRPTLLLGEAVVVWRDGAGRIVAAADRCPHRGTALSLGKVEGGGELVCPYHGWRFAPDGACTHIPQLAPGAPIPKRARLSQFAALERHGLVWVCLGDPAAPVPDFPEWSDPRYRHVACPTYTWRTSPGRMLENFTDFGHLGYLHDGLLGSQDDLVVPPHRVERDGIALRYELVMEVPNPKDRFAIANLEQARGTQRNTYVLTLPFVIHLACTYVEQGTHRTLFFAVQPHGDGTCTGYCYQSRDYELDHDDAPYAAFQDLLAEQDRVVVESQAPAALPLEPAAELHLPFDRVAVAYRRALADLAAITTRAEDDGDEPPGSVRAPSSVGEGGVRAHL